MEALSGPQPRTAGVHEFSSSIGLSLQPGTSYWFVQTNSDPIENNQFAVGLFTGSTIETSVAGWLIGNSSFIDSGNQGATWGASGFGPAQMSVQALTVVPEPGGVGAIVAVGLATFGFARRRLKRSIVNHQP